MTSNLRTRIHAAAKTAWARLRGGELTPARAAASVAVGLAVGLTPLYGAHFWIVVAICLPLRLDAALAYLAANISLPFISPFILLAEVELGSWARTGRFLALHREEVQSRALVEYLREVVAGTAILSPAGGLLGGGVTWIVAARGRRRRLAETPFEGAVARVASRYAGGRRAAYHYVRGKLAGDPVAARICALGPLGRVADVGCGRGQLAVLLLEAGGASEVRGTDWDAAKVVDATRAAGGLAARFEAGDMRTAPIEPCDTVLLVDVLHYLTDAEQDEVIARAAEAASARVVVRELDPDRGWRSAVTRLQERVTTSLGYNRGARVNVRSIDRLAEPLRARGFEVQVSPCWGATPFANVLLVAERR